MAAPEAESPSGQPRSQGRWGAWSTCWLLDIIGEMEKCSRSSYVDSNLPIFTLLQAANYAYTGAGH